MFLIEMQPSDLVNNNPKFSARKQRASGKAREEI